MSCEQISIAAWISASFRENPSPVPRITTPSSRGSSDVIIKRLAWAGPCSASALSSLWMGQRRIEWKSLLNAKLVEG